MARFEVRFTASVAKDLRGLPKTELRRILARIDALRDDPRPDGCELYRVRQGVYRIVYSIHDARRVVEVVRVGHRREIDRG